MKESGTYSKDQDAEAGGVIEVRMKKEAPVFQEYVEDKLEALYTVNI